MCSSSVEPLHTLHLNRPTLAQMRKDTPVKQTKSKGIAERAASVTCSASSYQSMRSNVTPYSPCPSQASQSTPSPPSSPIPSSRKPGPPPLRYTQPVTKVGTLRVRTKLTTRRRFCRLDNGILTIHSQSNDCGFPIVSFRLVETEAIKVCNQKSTITIRTDRKTNVTLVFKDDKHLLQPWLDALNHARQMTIERYYTICEKIGSGQYSKVFRTVDRKTDESFAVKKISKTHDTDKNILTHVQREMQIVRRIHHQNIIRTVDIFETSGCIYIVMEYVKQGTLMNYLKQNQYRISEVHAMKIIQQILSAVAYLHSEGIIHRDIKADNVLFTNDGVVKLADFGLARQIGGVGTDGFSLLSVLGTPAYSPPEIISGNPYGKPVDVYSTGVLAYILLSGQFPFLGNSPRQVFERIKKGRVRFPRSRWGMISSDAIDFIRKLLNIRASSRPGALAALSHPWFRRGPERGLKRRETEKCMVTVRSNSSICNASAIPMAAVTSDPHIMDEELRRKEIQFEDQQQNFVPFNHTCAIRLPGGSENHLDVHPTGQYSSITTSMTSCPTTNSSMGLVTTYHTTSQTQVQRQADSNCHSLKIHNNSISYHRSQNSSTESADRSIPKAPDVGHPPHLMKRSYQNFFPGKMVPSEPRSEVPQRPVAVSSKASTHFHNCTALGSPPVTARRFRTQSGSLRQLEIDRRRHHSNLVDDKQMGLLAH